LIDRKKGAARRVTFATEVIGNARPAERRQRSRPRRRIHQGAYNPLQPFDEDSHEEFSRSEWGLLSMSTVDVIRLDRHDEFDVSTRWRPERADGGSLTAAEVTTGGGKDVAWTQYEAFPL
jgi:hypothetical protein